MDKAVDSIQQHLTNYAYGLKYDDLSPEAIHAAKARVIDTLGVLIGGFFGEPCRIARKLAAQFPNSEGATIIGTRMKTTPDMAAFVNGTAARYLEMNDTYHSPGSFFGHPSDVLVPILAAGEHARVGGRVYLTSVILAYEIYQRICDVFRNDGIDNTTFSCLGAAVAAGKLLGLSRNQLSHCISMAIVPNVILRQIRMGHLSMFKAAAAGQAGRAGVFAALLARVGMEGPHLPFEGKAGWCDHVAGERFSLDTMGGNGTPFKIQDTLIKYRCSAGNAIPSILAAEKVALTFKTIKEIQHVTVEVYKTAKIGNGTGEQRWNPDSREGADHSIPYVVAATLMDGTITPGSFDDAHLANPELRALMQKVEVIEDEAFTKAYESSRVQHYARVTVHTSDGERLIGELQGDEEELSTRQSDAPIAKKFHGLTEDLLGTKQVNAILDHLWHLEDVENIADIPGAFVIV